MVPLTRFASFVVIAALPYAGPSPARAEGPAQVSEGAKVSMAFTITVPETNTVIPNNVREFVVGQEEVFPAVDKALKGMKSGDEKRIDLQPEEAFGRYDANKKIRVKRDLLPSEAQTGTILKSSNGMLFTVAELADQSAVLDFNHPLAGKQIVLDVKILNVEGQGIDGAVR
jgi:FKBP-type peptidyl-prolyl cis-trans isomerase 2